MGYERQKIKNFLPPRPSLFPLPPPLPCLSISDNLERITQLPTSAKKLFRKTALSARESGRTFSRPARGGSRAPRWNLAASPAQRPRTRWQGLMQQKRADERSNDWIDCDGDADARRRRVLQHEGPEKDGHSAPDGSEVERDDRSRRFASRTARQAFQLQKSGCTAPSACRAPALSSPIILPLACRIRFPCPRFDSRQRVVRRGDARSYASANAAGVALPSSEEARMQNSCDCAMAYLLAMNAQLLLFTISVTFYRCADRWSS